MPKLQSAWVERVRARAPRVAVFDCDGTLWRPDSGAGFMRWSLTEGMVAPERAERLRERYRRYEAGQVSEAAICGEMVQVYAGLQEGFLREAAARYVREHVLPEVFPEMERLVGVLRAGGAEIWAVSSTWNFVVEAGVRERFGIGADRVLAAEARIVDDLLTDELLAVPTGEAKAAALRAAGIPEPDAVFGNSVHDLPMLEMARWAYPVNASAELRAAAGARGWELFEPALASSPPGHPAAK